ncbi:MAG: hypothetical protein VW438_02560 [Euryarchaeota archaeon]
MITQYYRKFDNNVHRLYFLANYFYGFENQFVPVMNKLLDKLKEEKSWDTTHIKFTVNANIDLTISFFNEICDLAHMTTRKKIDFVCKHLPDEFIITQRGQSDDFVLVQVTNLESKIA